MHSEQLLSEQLLSLYFFFFPQNQKINNIEHFLKCNIFPQLGSIFYSLSIVLYISVLLDYKKVDCNVAFNYRWLEEISVRIIARACSSRMMFMQLRNREGFQNSSGVVYLYCSWSPVQLSSHWKTLSQLWVSAGIHTRFY